MADRTSLSHGADIAPARSWWGWGDPGQALPDAECAELAALVPGASGTAQPIPSIASLELPPVRVSAPRTLAHLVSGDPADRAGHTYGKAFRDVVRALHGDLAAAPDLVAFPREERDVVDLLDWAAASDVAVIPYGAGSSVVGGIEYRAKTHSGVLSMDLSGMGRVLEIDRVSRSARIQAGALGPCLEAQLRPHGLTLRHFPQSFAFSTLGGWLATRAGGHYATLHTHIDDLTAALRVVTPAGVSESLRLPGSGAGPSPDRLFLGSEGTLGIITEAWMRLQDRPVHKASASVVFDRFPAAVDAVRAVAQSGLYPANCRLLDPGEAALSGVAGGGRSVLVLGVESAHHPVDGRLAELVALARDHGGSPVGGSTAAGDSAARDSAAEAWRSAFLRMPYIRDGLARMSVISETFETACTWDRFPELYEAVHRDVGAAVRAATGAEALINCRFTHVYPDGPAPYFTVIAPGRRGSEVAMWDAIKAAAMHTLGEHRATVTHHHAVGRDHRPGYDRQRPEPFALALRAAKQALDPAGILNPGVLFDAAG
ncbi:FAD-linked oxidase C-terminal domain-containing protein [Streptomyces sp. ATCC51928]|uniref:FAD-linked oxidase C-terminal domain-containing protein n=1 Tax=Streptomyces caviscabies TaxID=90079 RepID=A0ABW2MM67_9ACTN|nr:MULTISPECIES: FAD-linked oxidase C-terminal domain-containing protein [unclassified Streptomyces]MDX3503771.1 FAD-linked oxidase C-terminal domain-containing protein [Streptomyces sp. ATCC51928]MDX5525739.1 FAD-linked oxidase C-terminal domain-containing protein [Streptomyces sp. DE06-01C]